MKVDWREIKRNENAHEATSQEHTYNKVLCFFLLLFSSELYCVQRASGVFIWLEE